jgi:hypothetical protein
MKQAILLVHGMGTFAPANGTTVGAFTKEFDDATAATLGAFAKHKGDRLTNHLDLHEFNFSKEFDDLRAIFAERAKNMSDRIKGVEAAYGVTLPLQLVAGLNSWEAKFGDNSFFFTHWLDVLFYGTLIGQKIRVEAGLTIAALVAEYGAGNVHIIAHSLGTAVVHDTLHLLYRPESDADDTVPDLDPVNAQLGSVWMFANVSRLTNKVVPVMDPYASIVRPAPTGCAGAFFNVRHKLDPFTWLAQFDPQNDGRWVSQAIFATRYQNIVTELVMEANTHSFARYVQDPNVVLQMLPFLLQGDFKADFVEFKAVSARYAAQSIEGAFAALSDSLSALAQDATSISGWADFLRTAKTFQDAIAHLKAAFP